MTQVNSKQFDEKESPDSLVNSLYFLEHPLKVKLLSPLGKLPVRATPGSAGYDLFSSENIKIEPNGIKMIKTDISMAIPSGYYGRVAPRSSLATKHINVGAGVIDEDYRGEVKVVMYNLGKTDFFSMQLFIINF